MVEPIRTCVGCRQKVVNSALARVVAVETQVDEFRLCVDRTGTLPGRGAWVHPSPKCIAQAIKRRVWARALKLSGTFDVSELNDLSEFLSDPSAGKRVEEVVEAR